MSDYTPTVAFVEREYVTGRLRRPDVTAPEARAEFDRMIAEVKRTAAEKALTDAADDFERSARAGLEPVINLATAKVLRAIAEAY